MNETKKQYRELCSHIRDQRTMYSQSGEEGQVEIDALYQTSGAHWTTVWNAFRSVFHGGSGEFAGWVNRDRWHRFFIRKMALRR